MERVLVTGAAGFIGSHVTESLLADGVGVLGIDNLCDFYSPKLKRSNLDGVRGRPGFCFVEADIRDRDRIPALIAEFAPDAVIHLAAMAGVRPSLKQPVHYADVNLTGTAVLLDAAVRHGVKRFLFASSSSVYGNNSKVPFAESDPVEQPISPYASTKRSGEHLCYTAWHLHRMPITCLRFFTVYGPRQRPDLAIHKFLRRISRGEPITMFGDGTTSRDYTYIDDIVTGVRSALDHCHAFDIFNLGSDAPVALRELIELIEETVGERAVVEQLPMQPGDVERSWADLTRSQRELGYAPSTTLQAGVLRQWEWMRDRVRG